MCACPATKGFWLYEDTVLTPSEILEIELFKRLSSRNRIYQGYCSQYQYFRQQKLRPSAFQDQIDKLDKSQMVGDTYILVANEMAGSTQVA